MVVRMVAMIVVMVKRVNEMARAEWVIVYGRDTGGLYID